MFCMSVVRLLSHVTIINNNNRLSEASHVTMLTGEVCVEIAMARDVKCDVSVGRNPSSFNTPPPLQCLSPGAT